ncbi:MAG TPA: nuclear transport factor 2 family protein [Rhizomicrobium sp.]|nr:nuclear transport factor 2 family protein [Rhizomicrobium sp.]
MRSALGIALAALVAAWSATAKAEDSQSPPAATARQQASNLLRDWVTAENEHDAAALERILDDKFISTYGAGKPVRRDAFIKSLTSGKADPRQSQTLTDETVIVDGDTAILVGTNTFHRTDGAQPDGLALRYTITCVRRNGRWVALAEHIVKMQP